MKSTLIGIFAKLPVDGVSEFFQPYLGGYTAYMTAYKQAQTKEYNKRTAHRRSLVVVGPHACVDSYSEKPYWFMLINANTLTSSMCRILWVFVIHYWTYFKQDIYVCFSPLCDTII